MPSSSRMGLSGQKLRPAALPVEIAVVVVGLLGRDWNRAKEELVLIAPTRGPSPSWLPAPGL